MLFSNKIYVLVEDNAIQRPLHNKFISLCLFVHLSVFPRHSVDLMIQSSSKHVVEWKFLRARNFFIIFFEKVNIGMISFVDFRFLFRLFIEIFSTVGMLSFKYVLIRFRGKFVILVLESSFCEEGSRKQRLTGHRLRYVERIFYWDGCREMKTNCELLDRYTCTRCEDWIVS